MQRIWQGKGGAMQKTSKKHQRSKPLNYSVAIFVITENCFPSRATHSGHERSEKQKSAKSRVCCSSKKRDSQQRQNPWRVYGQERFWTFARLTFHHEHDPSARGNKVPRLFFSDHFARTNKQTRPCLFLISPPFFVCLVLVLLFEVSFLN